jgi:L-2-hydroxyglutarate oxidase LhgO
VVATTNDQIEYLDRLHAFTQSPELSAHAYRPTNDAVPTYFLSGDEARDLEPDLGRNVKAAMLSTETGIVDAHGLMESLEMEIAGGGGDGAGDSNGHVVLGTKVVRIDPYFGPSSGEYAEQPKTGILLIRTAARQWNDQGMGSSNPY